MNQYVDVDLHQLIQGPGSRSPASAIEVKSQDTIEVNLYFCSSGVVLDLGESPVLKYGLVAVSDVTTLLVLETTFARRVDSNELVYYQALAAFNTSEMVAALAAKSPLPCILEIRFQLADGEVVHTLDQAVTVDRTILLEAGVPAPTLIPGYPDVSEIELKSNKDEPSGYAALDAEGHLNPAVIPADPLDLTDFQTALGVSIINQAIGIFNRLIAGTGMSFDTTTTPGAIILNCTLTGGTIVAVSSLTDFETSVGASLINDASGILNRIAAGAGISLDTGTTPGAIIVNAAALDLTDATTTGLSLISVATGILKRLVAGTGVTLDTTTTPGAIIINVSGGGGGLTLVDAETSTGDTLLGATNGQVKRLVAGTNMALDNSTTPGALILNASGSGLTLVDAETSAGDTLLGSTNGQVKRIIAGTNITLDATTTVGGLIINAASGGGGGITYSIYQNGTPGAFSALSGAQEDGTAFITIAAGIITGLQFYKAPGETGSSRTLRLWNSSGTLLASAVTSGETSSGWQVATLSTAYSLAPGSYVVSYTANAQNPTGASATANGPFTTPSVQNLFNPTPGGFPTLNGGVGYWVDLVFQSSDTALSVGLAIQAAAASSSTYAAFQTAVAAIVL